MVIEPNWEKWLNSDKCEVSGCSKKASHVIQDKLFMFFKVCPECYIRLLDFDHDNGIRTRSWTMKEWEANFLPSLSRGVKFVS